VWSIATSGHLQLWPGRDPDPRYLQGRQRKAGSVGRPAEWWVEWSVERWVE
jgi:hypothetical protein